MSLISAALDATPLLHERTGVGDFCAGALAALARRGDVDTLAFGVSWRRRHGIAAAVPDGVRAVLRPLPARPTHLAWRWSRIPPIEWVTGRVDVVHGTNFIVPPARRAARVVTVHDLTVVLFPEMCSPATLGFPRSIRRAIDDGAFVHTPSRFVAAEVIEHFGAAPERVRAIHHGLPPGELTDQHHRSPPPGVDPEPPPDATDRLIGKTGGGPPYILAIGTIEPRKDYPTLVAAFTLLAAEHPELRLVVVGGDGWGVESFDAAVAACPARERIVRTGYISTRQRDRLISGAAVFCYPSIYEGFGFPPLLAMAGGVPVVASTAGALPEVLGEAARLVPPRQPEALAAGVGSLLTDSEARAVLIAAGYRRTAEFSWEETAQGLVELYRRAAAER